MRKWRFVLPLANVFTTFVSYFDTVPVLPSGEIKAQISPNVFSLLLYLPFLLPVCRREESRPFVENQRRETTFSRSPL